MERTNEHDVLNFDRLSRTSSTAFRGKLRIKMKQVFCRNKDQAPFCSAAAALSAGMFSVLSQRAGDCPAVRILLPSLGSGPPTQASGTTSYCSSAACHRCGSALETQTCHLLSHHLIRQSLVIQYVMVPCKSSASQSILLAITLQLCFLGLSGKLGKQGWRGQQFEVYWPASSGKSSKTYTVS